MNRLGVTERREKLARTAHRIRRIALVFKWVGPVLAVVGVLGLVVNLGTLLGTDPNLAITFAIVSIPTGASLWFMGLLLDAAAQFAEVTADMAARIDSTSGSAPASPG